MELHEIIILCILNFICESFYDFEIIIFSKDWRQSRY